MMRAGVARRGERTFVAQDGRWVGDSLMARLADGRALLWAWARREAAVRYRQSALGFAWVLLQPAISLAVIGFIVSRVFGVDGGGIPYVPFAYAGLVIWGFTASTVGLGVPSMLNNMNVVSKVYFPREVVPLSVALANAIDLLIGTLLLICVAAIAGISPQPTLIALPLPLLLAWATVSAATTIASAVSVFIRDLRHVVPFVLQLGFFLTPVMYPVGLLPDGARWLTSGNPVAVAIEALRDTVLRGQWPDWPLLLVHLVAGLGLLILSSAYVRSVEPRLADVA